MKDLQMFITFLSESLSRLRWVDPADRSPEDRALVSSLWEQAKELEYIELDQKTLSMKREFEEKRAMAAIPVQRCPFCEFVLPDIRPDRCPGCELELDGYDLAMYKIRFKDRGETRLDAFERKEARKIERLFQDTDRYMELRRWFNRRGFAAPRVTDQEKPAAKPKVSYWEAPQDTPYEWERQANSNWASKKLSEWLGRGYGFDFSKAYPQNSVYAVVGQYYHGNVRELLADATWFCLTRGQNYTVGNPAQLVFSIVCRPVITPSKGFPAFVLRIQDTQDINSWVELPIPGRIITLYDNPAYWEIQHMIWNFRGSDLTPPAIAGEVRVFSSKRLSRINELGEEVSLHEVSFLKDGKTQVWRKVLLEAGESSWFQVRMKAWWAETANERQRIAAAVSSELFTIEPEQRPLYGFNEWGTEWVPQLERFGNNPTVVLPWSYRPEITFSDGTKVRNIIGVKSQGAHTGFPFPNDYKTGHIGIDKILVIPVDPTVPVAQSEGYLMARTWDKTLRAPNSRLRKLSGFNVYVVDPNFGVRNRLAKELAQRIGGTLVKSVPKSWKIGPTQAQNNEVSFDSPLYDLYY